MAADTAAPSAGRQAVSGRTRYAMLVLPAANRVYAETAVELLQAELAVLGRTVLEDRLGEIRSETLGGVPYVTFSAEGGLADTDVGYLSNLSSLYGLFAREGHLLEPVELRRLDRYDDDLLTIQKYQGKTNEHFTKLLLNVTLLASSFAGEMLERRFSVFDPLCGRGTTLNQALMYGFDAAGVDLDKKDFEAYQAFIKTWLKRKRIKHQAETGSLRKDRRHIGRRLEVTLAPTKEEYKAGGAQSLTMYQADTLDSGELFRRAAFDLVVADAPYGVQHGSRTVQAGLRRHPAELVAQAAPVWAELLRPGGALGLSFNTYVARWDELAVELADAGLEVVDAEPFRGFAHRVDQAIVRDLIVACKPG